MRMRELVKKTAVTMCAAALTMTMIANSMVVRAEDPDSNNPAGETAPTTTTASTIDTTKTGSMTIHKYDGLVANTPSTGNEVTVGDNVKPIQGAKFTYIKVADITTLQTETVTNGAPNGQASLQYTISDQALNKILGNDKADVAWTSDTLNAALTANNKSAVETYVKGNMNQDNTITTDENGAATATSLDLGLYLVAETEFPANIASTTNPFFVSIPMADSVIGESGNWNYAVHVYPKNQTDLPYFNKYVKDDGDAEYTDVTSTSEGDTIDYIIVVKVPVTQGANTAVGNSTGTELSNFTITDTLATGLSYIGTDNNVTVAIHKITSDTTPTAADAKTAIANSDNTWTNFTATQQNNVMTINPTDDGLKEINSAALSGKYLVIYYQAKVASAASVVLGDNGNDNTAQVNFKRNNDTTTGGTTLKDTARVYTYGISLTKQFSGGDTDKFDKVHFNLKDAAGNVLEVVGTNGVYYVTKDATEKTTTIVPYSTNGKVVINGLEAGTYSLVETQTATGYALLKEEISIVIASTTDIITPDSATKNDSNVMSIAGYAVTMSGNGTNDASATVDDKPVTMKGNDGNANGTTNSNNALVPLTITNTKSFTLPSTGGLGAIICTMIGAVVFAGAVIFLRKKA